MFRSPTSIWFGSRFLPPQPKLPPGVPMVAAWEVTNSKGMGDTSSYVHVTLWGKTEVDDRIYIALTDPPREASEKVSGGRDEPKARASFHFEKTWLRGRGRMTLWYRPGSTGQKHELGTAELDVRNLLGRGFVAYSPDPVQGDPPDYERPQIVFYTRVDEKTRVTLRCEHNGKPEEAVLMGTASYSPYEAGHLRRHHIPLPIRIPLRGGRTRGTWHRALPGEKLPVDRFPDEAAGLWTCRASLNGRVARRFEVRFRPDGSLVPHGTIAKLAPPWWPIKTERIENDVEQQRERELSVEDAEEERREQERQEHLRRR